MIGAVGDDSLDRTPAPLATASIKAGRRAVRVSTGVAVIVRIGGDNRIILDHGATTHAQLTTEAAHENADRCFVTQRHGACIG